MTRYRRIAHYLNLKNALVQILLALMACPLIAFAQSDLPLKATHLETDPPAVQLTVLDSEGTDVYKACFSLTGLDPFKWAHKGFYEIASRSYIHEKLLISSHITIPLTSLNEKSASKLSLDAVRKSGCPKRQY